MSPLSRRLGTASVLAVFVGLAGPKPGRAAAEPAAPAGGWRVGPVVASDGGFAYCVAEIRYATGQTLLISRNARDEFNIGLGLPGAHLPRRSAWSVTVRVDGDPSRTRQAVAAEAGMLVIANGADRVLFDAMTHGSTLTIDGPSDAIALQLSGSGKALPELKTCVDQARSGQTGKPLGRIGAGATGDIPALPPYLKKLLAEAGFKTIGLLPTTAAPPGYGPIDAVWKVGAVIGGIGETPGDANRSLSSLSETVLAAVKARCTRDFQVQDGPPDSLPGGSFRTSDITCDGAAGSVHIALLFNLGSGGLFRLIFHEAPLADAASADKNRDAIADVLKRLAN